MNNRLFSLLLRDAAVLLTPLSVTELTTSASCMERSGAMVRSHPHSMSILVLSDLHDVFSVERGQDDDKGRRENYITQKLVFYAAHILSTPSVILRSLVQEMIDKAGTIE